MDAQGQLTEFGVAPNVRVDMNPNDRTSDAILETAIHILTNSSINN
jgi:hypothetical protein